MASSPHLNRVPGLDLARALAIGLVLIAHYSLVFSRLAPIGPVFNGAGYYGVELFFALSGFLIGGILIRTAPWQGGAPGLRRFWTRRWLRTLPAYYLVLVGLLLLNSKGFSLAHLVFLQNFFPYPRDYFFGVSWSLVIEEWFYLLLPVVLLVASRIWQTDTRRMLLTLCVSGIVLCLLGRLVDAALFHAAWGDIRKAVFIRMDALLFGVLLAVAKAFHPELYARAQRWRRPILWGAVLVLAMTGLRFIVAPGLGALFDRTLMFTIVSACSAMVVFGLEAVRLPQGRAARAITWLSVISYSLYLTHWDVMQLALRANHAPSHIIRCLFTAAAGLAVSLALATLLYRGWEKPFMDLRDRLPKAAAAARPAAKQAG
jgi:peptidoglycan/LPS O-acetylase OafA/YrhL